jgi:hypothetical protein
MTQGVTGTYAINGTDLSLQPSTGQWLGRDILGTDGNGRAIYPNIRSFEMSWDVMPIVDLHQITDLQEASDTSPLVVDLPRWATGINDYQFRSYSGTYAEEPVVGQYFEQHVMEVKLVIRNIRTN